MHRGRPPPKTPQLPRAGTGSPRFPSWAPRPVRLAYASRERRHDEIELDAIDPVRRSHDVGADPGQERSPNRTAAATPFARATAPPGKSPVQGAGSSRRDHHDAYARNSPRASRQRPWGARISPRDERSSAALPGAGAEADNIGSRSAECEHARPQPSARARSSLFEAGNFRIIPR
jgi:hypothetical protein